MKHLNEIFFLLMFAINLNSYAAGGPDAYGYTWLDSNDPGGPTYSWVDITTIGTEITGLSDDNSVTLIDMGLTFGYYWTDYSEVTIGSNGWLGFNDFGNLSVCFDDIPTEGGTSDNFVSPFMTDINFAGANNPSKAYYYQDAVNNEFIVSYVNVPYFKNNADGYLGSNTFQVIFSGDDNSITFQYQNMDQENYEINQNCPNTLLVGMENVSGTIGLETHHDMLPSDNYAVKFIYPDMPLLEVIDLAPIWNQNTNNTAMQYEANQDIDLLVNVGNLGNRDTLSLVDVLVEVLDNEENIVYSDSMQISQLLSQQTSTLNLINPLNVGAGDYQLKVSTDSMDDTVLSNNSLSTEINVVDTSMTPLELRHLSGGFLTHIFYQLKMATFFNTPSGNWMIKSINAFVREPTDGGVTPGNRVSIYANDGGDGLPGSLLATEIVVDATDYTYAWVNTELSEPIMAPANGFFVAWEKVDPLGSPTSVGIVSTNNLPLSRLTYEYTPDGSWRVAGSNHTHDLALEVELTNDLLDTIFANGFESQ